MPISTFEGKTPVLADSVYVADSAIIIGDVVIQEDSSIWPTTVIRADINSIRIGKRCSIQDATVIHVNHAGDFNPTGDAVEIGDDVTVGHRVTLHGCNIANRCLIGIGSIVMDAAKIESNVIVGAGSLVPRGKVLESGYLWLGSPVKRVRELTAEELKFLEYSANYYVKLKNRYLISETR